MKRALPILCLVGAAGVWAFALFAPKEARLVPLPERFVGVYDLSGFEPARGGTPDLPLPPGRGHVFRFSAEGTYSLSVMLHNGYEMLRREGTAVVSDEGVMTLTQVSTNRKEDRGPVDRYHAEWGQDEHGPFLALRHVEQGYTLRMRKR